jgi:hypothetical protein
MCWRVDLVTGMEWSWCRGSWSCSATPVRVAECVLVARRSPWLMRRRQREKRTSIDQDGGSDFRVLVVKPELRGPQTGLSCGHEMIGLQDDFDVLLLHDALQRSWRPLLVALERRWSEARENSQRLSPPRELDMASKMSEPSRSILD